MRWRWLFLFFLVSGLCSLMDEVVWLRVAMAQFGVVTPLVSIVLSVFMAGLALGSWQGGRLAKRAGAWPILSPLRLYAGAELCIAASAVAVPPLLALGRGLLMTGRAAVTWGSARYHVAAGLCIAPVLLPFCVCMGATFPLAMAALRDASPGRRAFGHLYTANVLGATLGTLASAFVLVEMLGLRGTLRAAAILNVAIAVGALILSRTRPAAGEQGGTTGETAGVTTPVADTAPVPGESSLLTMLFATGLASMAMEVVWVRQFTPYLGTVVYSFATILALYLAATFLGSAVYRLCSGRRRWGAAAASLAPFWIVAGLSGLLPLVATDPRLPLPIIDPASPQPADLVIGGARVALGLGLFCAVVGFMTPLLVDRFSGGDPEKAGRAYAVNVLGCILGPIVASFLLLPALGERGAIAALSLPFLVLGPVVAGGLAARDGFRSRLLVAGGALVLALVLVVTTQDYTGLFARYQVRRDYEATVIATDARGPKELLVNGVGITALTPITKVMVHLPLSFFAAPPRSVLVICFGMGTSFRSALSWGVPTTAAELVPSVPDLFGFYHADGPELLKSPLGRVVIDDGRRYLERTREEYDLISIDPPPPVEAAGSSLLYSREFYALARRRLRPGGILQQWFPGGEPRILVSVTRALTEEFPHVRAFPSIAGWGFHLLASDRPIPETAPAVLASRLPPRAASDLVEWFEGATPELVFQRLLAQEVKPDQILAIAPGTPALTDDRPFNEYYLLRRMFAPDEIAP